MQKELVMPYEINFNKTIELDDDEDEVDDLLS